MFGNNGKNVNFEEPIEMSKMMKISKETEEQYAKKFPNDTKAHCSPGGTTKACVELH